MDSRQVLAVINGIDYGVLFMGPDLHSRIVNRAFREMWGFTETFTESGPSMHELLEYNRHRGVYDVPDSFAGTYTR